MAKRFIHTDVLLSPSVRSAPTLYKLLWVGLFTRCDHAGIWIVDWELMSLYCGGKIEPETAFEIYRDNIFSIDNGKRIFVPGFLEFQYPQGIFGNAAPVVSARKELFKYGLIDVKNQRITNPSHNPYPTLPIGLHVTHKDKDKDKDRDKDRDKNESEGIPFDKFKSLYPTRFFNDLQEMEYMRVWVDLDEPTKSKILIDIPKRYNSNPEFMPKAINYLRNGGWNDPIRSKNGIPETPKFASKPKPFEQ